MQLLLFFCFKEYNYIFCGSWHYVLLPSIMINLIGVFIITPLICVLSYNSPGNQFWTVYHNSLWLPLLSSTKLEFCLKLLQNFSNYWINSPKFLTEINVLFLLQFEYHLQVSILIYTFLNFILNGLVELFLFFHLLEKENK